MRYIIIIGVNFDNKGAEAMMFHLYQYLQEAYPDRKVVALCKTSGKQLEEIKERYKLRALSCYMADFFYAEGGLYRFAGRVKGIQGRQNCAKVRKILDNTDLCVDASGFNFSSKFGLTDNYAWLKNIDIMKRHRIPVVIMPQSFGPFDFPKWYGWGLKLMARKTLKYPQRIFARERTGFMEMKAYCRPESLFLSPDLVLLGENLKPELFYRNRTSVKKYTVASGSVAIVPNQKLKIHSSELTGEKIYMAAINMLLKEGRHVYIIRHCESDKAFCDSLAAKFQDRNNVTYIDADIDCMEYAGLIRQFDFAVVSRYHGIVHSYKEGTPCVVIGWADKYQELLEKFSQNKYLINLSGYSENELCNKIHDMNLNYQREETIIKGQYHKLLEKNTLYKTAFAWFNDVKCQEE